MNKSLKKKSLPARFFAMAIKLTAAAVILVVGINLYIIKSTEDKIAVSADSVKYTVTSEELQKFKSIEPECILVLGASVKNDGTPSGMLKQRLDLAIELYEKGAAPKLLFSGDNGQVVYNEVSAMKNYAVDKGVPEEDIFLDHAGFSTYESVYRAKEVFRADSVIVVTQRYHLYRALYGCDRMNIEALGAASDQREHSQQETRELREVLARDKDFIKWIFKPQPTFTGNSIPVNGDGRETH